ncbi:prolyl 4-hydroxylase subunit alpha-2-like isoform X2 [Drosophila mauritiana]|uniref:procollagen-proline 4-dioxygenase n=3 Tax=Drosophila mauritiana TaxID=7226 RepID=A0A6P8K2J3_DROMA|nr:prolyl 4-hydroxylase subunit alpha-2-like isoform X2 [Drosophila mauritiana]
MFILKYLKFIGFLSACFICCQGFVKSNPKKSYAASTMELMKLLEVEDELVNNLNGYVKTLKMKFNLMERYLIDMSIEHREMKSEYESYLGNPLNSFRLIHRLHTSWRKWYQYAIRIDNNALVHIENARLMRKMLPTSSYLEHACRGIHDLMSCYDLKPEELAAGNLAGYSQPETGLTAYDCLALGEFSVQKRKDDLAEAWYNLSLNRFENKFDKYRVHKAWALLLAKNKQFTEAFHHFENKPEEIVASNEVIHFEEELATKQNCTAVVQKPSRLQCRYNSSTTPFTRIAPLKMEELSLDPYMVVFHDVVYDTEIDGMLNSSNFGLSLTDSGQKSEVRTSKDSYIVDAKSLNERVTDMTGFSMEMSDPFSLINYGLGGHYMLHYDFHEYTNTTRPKQGDRIATVLFYLGEVDSGGATIFPKINIAVTPKKGSAVFWYNLHNSGAMNLKSLHSACPVISGSKYVLTKWINELPQMFVTPCMKDSNLHLPQKE